MAKEEEEHRDYEAARTVQALCLAAGSGDMENLARLWAVERTGDEWKSIAEQAICSLVGAMRIQTRDAGVTPQIFHKSSIQALLFLQARGAPPARLTSP